MSKTRKCGAALMLCALIGTASGAYSGRVYVAENGHPTTNGYVWSRYAGIADAGGDYASLQYSQRHKMVGIGKAQIVSDVYAGTWTKANHLPRVEASAVLADQVIFSNLSPSAVSFKITTAKSMNLTKRSVTVGAIAVDLTAIASGETKADTSLKAWKTGVEIRGHCGSIVRLAIQCSSNARLLGPFEGGKAVECSRGGIQSAPMYGVSYWPVTATYNPKTGAGSIKGGMLLTWSQAGTDALRIEAKQPDGSKQTAEIDGNPSGLPIASARGQNVRLIGG